VARGRADGGRGGAEPGASRRLRPGHGIRGPLGPQGLQALEAVSRSRATRLTATRFVWHMLGVLRLRDRFERLPD